MKPNFSDIELYLEEVKIAVSANRYRIELNDSRPKNLDLFFRYILDEQGARDIILGLEATDFSEIRKNTNAGYEHELLYVFGKEVMLVERFGVGERRVPLYIKFNKVEDGFVFVVSFHEEEFPLNYIFK